MLETQIYFIAMKANQNKVLCSVIFLQDTRPDDLLSAAFTGVLNQTKLPPERLGDIVVGNVLLPGGGAVQARFAQILQVSILGINIK